MVGAYAAECARVGHLCGYIGASDYRLNPIIRPGAVVEIDISESKVTKQHWFDEHDRPVYFVELHDEYACTWCDLMGKSLSLVPHPRSNVHVRQVVIPDQAEIVGRVKSVLQPIVNSPIRLTSHEPSN